MLTIIFTKRLPTCASCIVLTYGRRNLFYGARHPGSSEELWIVHSTSCVMKVVGSFLCSVQKVLELNP
jgi:hypothetical protein